MIGWENFSVYLKIKISEACFGCLYAKHSFFKQSSIFTPTLAGKSGEFVVGTLISFWRIIRSPTYSHYH